MNIYIYSSNKNHFLAFLKNNREKKEKGKNRDLYNAVWLYYYRVPKI